MPTLTRKLLALIVLVSSFAFAQVDDINAIAQDMVFLSDQYVTPAAEAAVYQSSGGWYTSAKSKDLWDLELSLQGNMLFIGSKHKQFLIDEADLLNIRIQGDATTAYTPTALGGDDYVVLEGNIGEDDFEFDSPQGLNEPNVKHAQLQAGLGLWYGTTVVARYSPKIKINKTYYQILGFGLQHNLTQWVSKDSLRTFDVSVLATYSFYSVSDTFSEVRIPIGRLNSVIVDGESFMFNLIASKEVKQFTFSAAAGLTRSSFSYTMGGEGEVLLRTLNQALETLAENKTLFKADVGVDYRFKRFSANTMMTFGKYTNWVLGLNYNFF